MSNYSMANFINFGDEYSHNESKKCNSVLFDTLIRDLDKQGINTYMEPYIYNSMRKYRSVKKYVNNINYNSGMTIHYEENRLSREQELTRLLGKGKPIQAFLVDEGNNNIQIQEVLDNAIINIYSFKTHKKITLFAPPPNRICLLYEMIGEFAPKELIDKSEDNVKKGFNKILCLNGQ